MTTPLAAAAPPADTESAVFEPIVTGDAVAQEVERFVTQLDALSSEQLAVRAAWSLGIVVGAIVLLWALRMALRIAARWLSPKRDKDDRHAKRERRHVGAWTMGVARFVVAMFAIGAVLYVWGFDMRAGAIGRALTAIWRAGLIVMLALAVIEVAGFAITRMMHRGARRSHDLRRAAQLRTLVPVLKGTISASVVVIAAMMVLSEVGIDIGPLIAGAGIIGLAVGFGAQTLVKDFLTGIFLIVEDIVSVGDVVEIGGFGGVVEEMSLRTIKLRDFDGTLHVFPYSEAQVIHNRTKSFSFAVFNLSVGYTSDISRALELMQRVGDELKGDAGFAEFILSPIEVVGVDQLGDSGVVLKGRIKTAPGKQWAVGREYLKRIKLAFDAAGVEIPFPHVKLVAPDLPVTGK